MTTTSRILQINTPLGAANTVLLQMSGSEALGRLPEYQLTLVSKRGKVTPAELLGKNITVGLEMPGGREIRYFNGYVTQFADAGSGPATWFQEGGSGRAYQYELTMHPWLWFLTRSANCRIYQNMTVPQVLKQVCAGYPFALLDAGMLSATYAAREYVCQYRETDFNFILRLMEQEGIYFNFRHENGKHTMRLFDSHGAHAPHDGYASIAYSDTGTVHPDDVEHITQWHVSHEVQPGRFALTDFDFKKPRVSLLGTANNRLKHDLDGFEFFDFPGEHETSDAGAAYARIRLEELQVRHKIATGAGAVRGIEPGCTFKLSGHPHEELDIGYLVSEASYSIANNAPGSGSGSGGDFYCSFRAIASDTQFRSPRVTPKPVVRGPQTAIVVGPDGEEIHVDAHGRVRLQFQWDRYNKADENSSCWVRVSQPWAGKGWGASFLPRIGQEVIVEFLEGDPDRPIVTGRVNNGESAPPWTLPAEKTRSGFRSRTHKGGASNFNELSFDDRQGAEEVFLQAERDKIERVKHDRYDDVGNDSHLTIEHDAFEEIKGDAHRKVVGDCNSAAGGSISFQVGEDWQATVGGKIALEAGNEIHLKAGMKVVIEAGVSLSLKVGANFVTINPAGIFIKGTMVMVNSGGTAGVGAGATPAAPTAPKAPRGSKGGSDMRPVRPKRPDVCSPQAQALKLAWKASTPFCEKCQAKESAE